MAISQEQGKRPLAPPPSPPWGEITPPGETAKVIRVFLADRILTYPAKELRRWEHAAGEPETLTLRFGTDHIVIEGAELAPIRAALDLQRLTEIRPTHARHRPGTLVRQITLESA